MSLITVQTGAGSQNGTVPDAGTDAYYPSLQALAALLKTTCEEEALHLNSVHIGDPNSNHGVLIGPTSDFRDVPIPAELIAQFGKGCIPLLTHCVRNNTKDNRWQPILNYNESNGISIHFDNSGATVPPNTARIWNRSAFNILIRGYLWFPKRSTASARFTVT